MPTATKGSLASARRLGGVAVVISGDNSQLKAALAESRSLVNQFAQQSSGAAMIGGGSVAMAGGGAGPSFGAGGGGGGFNPAYGARPMAPYAASANAAMLARAQTIWNRNAGGAAGLTPAGWSPSFGATPASAGASSAGGGAAAGGDSLLGMVRGGLAAFAASQLVRSAAQGVSAYRHGRDTEPYMRQFASGDDARGLASDKFIRGQAAGLASDRGNAEGWSAVKSIPILGALASAADALGGFTDKIEKSSAAHQRAIDTYVRMNAMAASSVVSMASKYGTNAEAESAAQAHPGSDLSKAEANLASAKRSGNRAQIKQAREVWEQVQQEASEDYMFAKGMDTARASGSRRTIKAFGHEAKAAALTGNGRGLEAINEERNADEERRKAAFGSALAATRGQVAKDMLTKEHAASESAIRARQENEDRIRIRDAGLRMATSEQNVASSRMRIGGRAFAAQQADTFTAQRNEIDQMRMHKPEEIAKRIAAMAAQNMEAAEMHRRGEEGFMAGSRATILGNQYAANRVGSGEGEYRAWRASAQQELKYAQEERRPQMEEQFASDDKARRLAIQRHLNDQETELKIRQTVGNAQADNTPRLAQAIAQTSRQRVEMEHADPRVAAAMKQAQLSEIKAAQFELSYKSGGHASAVGMSQLVNSDLAGFERDRKAAGVDLGKREKELNKMKLDDRGAAQSKIDADAAKATPPDGWWAQVLTQLGKIADGTGGARIM